MDKTNRCQVCGDKAHVANYGALSCPSCKIFFRRHGFHPEVCILHSFSYKLTFLFFRNFPSAQRIIYVKLPQNPEEYAVFVVFQNA